MKPQGSAVPYRIKPQGSTHLIGIVFQKERIPRFGGNSIGGEGSSSIL
jgi:hypothetical protein